MYKQRSIQWLAILVAAVFFWSGCLETLAAAAPEEKGFLSMTPSEIYKELGEPHYIRVIDYGAGVRYAYFTPDEWARIADMAPLEQGDDVYVRTIGGITWQYHFSYTPTYLEGRFAPKYRVKDYIIYPEGTVSLSQVAGTLPEGQLLHNADAVASIVNREGGYGPILVVKIPADSRDLEQEFRRFRERGATCLELEIGFSDRITAATLKADTAVSYIALRVGVWQTEDGNLVNLQTVLK
jgi:hypothetical protein